TVEVLATAFPNFAPLLLNGLFTQNEDLKAACARQIRQTTACRTQLALIVQVLADEMRETDVSEILRKSSQYLRA
ncbi:MAG TPA: hypothetical protein VGX50_09335, partial [Longimicrobium sp.]|nr:hypothetical protein [Longimicrobium sp.]